MPDRVECPACGSTEQEDFHNQADLPTNSCLLLPTSEEAVSYPTGPLTLSFCHSCGFIFNRLFDPNLAEYSPRYEETQSYSEKFMSFARSLSQKWVEKYDLSGKHVIEIGCGKGEFLVLMAEEGIGSGVGVDPGIHIDRIESPAADRLRWTPGFFNEDYGPLEADAVVCRHTLEHIPDVYAFLETVRKAIGDRLDTVVLFELPDTQRVLDEAAFWDVYYEHCSYFSAGSLVRLFERVGFEVLDISYAYDGQYLLLEARPSLASISSVTVDDMESLTEGVSHFANTYEVTVRDWEERLDVVAGHGGRSVIWGAGSKGVAFLAAVGSHIDSAVDINPNKHGMYMAGTGHRIVSPEELLSISPELVVAMNPIYRDEIARDIAALGLKTRVETV